MNCKCSHCVKYSALMIHWNRARSGIRRRPRGDPGSRTIAWLLSSAPVVASSATADCLHDSLFARSHARSKVCFFARYDHTSRTVPIVVEIQ